MKKTLLNLLVVLSILMLAACGAKEEAEKTTTQATDEVEKTENVTEEQGEEQQEVAVEEEEPKEVQNLFVSNVIEPVVQGDFNDKNSSSHSSYSNGDVIKTYWIHNDPAQEVFAIYESSVENEKWVQKEILTIQEKSNNDGKKLIIKTANQNLNLIDSIRGWETQLYKNSLYLFLYDTDLTNIQRIEFNSDGTIKSNEIVVTVPYAMDKIWLKHVLTTKGEGITVPLLKDGSIYGHTFVLLNDVENKSELIPKYDDISFVNAKLIDFNNNLIYITAKRGGVYAINLETKEPVFENGEDKLFEGKFDIPIHLDNERGIVYFTNVHRNEVHAYSIDGLTQISSLAIPKSAHEPGRIPSFFGVKEKTIQFYSFYEYERKNMLGSKIIPLIGTTLE